MKVIILTTLLSFGTLANITSLENCFKQTDSLDREYCSKKRLRSLDSKFKSKYSTWQKGYNQKTKNQALKVIKNDIAYKQSMLTQLQNEINLEKQHLKKVTALLSHEEHKQAKKNKKKAKIDKAKRKAKKLFKKIF